MRLKVVSWNIWVDCYFDQVKDFLGKSRADIIGLQEVKQDDPSRDVIKYLNSLGYSHVYAPVSKEWDGVVHTFGPAIFTKHKLVSSGTQLLAKVDARSVAFADIKIKDMPLHIFNTHLPHTHQKNSPAQLDQAIQLLKLIPKTNSILMGDFNAIPESTTIKSIKEKLLDTDSNNQPTWSVYPEGCVICNPKKIDTRLDYIFTTNDIKTDSYKVEKSRGSDHLPVSVFINI